MEQKQKQKIIYSKRICEQLMMRGFRPVDIIPNAVRQEFVCWVFDWTEEFDEALCEVLGGAR